MADTIVTPVNDSFIDLDMLGHIDPRTGDFKTLGNFARLVEHLKDPGIALRSTPLDWVVMQNRSRSLATNNERKVRDALDKIAPAAGFRIVPGLSERVTYRELFPLGLTLFDLDTLPDLGKAQPNAREEIWAMLRALNLPSAALKRAIAPPTDDGTERFSWRWFLSQSALGWYSRWRLAGRRPKAKNATTGPADRYHQAVVPIADQRMLVVVMAEVAIE
eukprot:gene32676-55189_t